MENSPIEVSDWSQKYKLAILLIFVLVGLFVVIPGILKCIKYLKIISCGEIHGTLKGEGWWEKGRGSTSDWKGYWKDDECIKVPVYKDEGLI